MPTTKKEGPDLAKLAKLVAVAIEENQRQAAVLEELNQLLAGAPGLGPALKDLYNFWNTLWPHGDYVFNFAKDGPAMKRLLKMLGQAELEGRMVCYLKNTDPFYANKKHPFTMFVATINQHTTPVVFRETVPGCGHVPQCLTDAEHTRRRHQEVTA